MKKALMTLLLATSLTHVKAVTTDEDLANKYLYRHDQRQVVVQPKPAKAQKQLRRSFDGSKKKPALKPVPVSRGCGFSQR